MFRILENFLSLLGYILVVILFVFSIYPLEKINKEIIQLPQIYSECDEKKIKIYKQEYIFNSNLENLTSELNLNISLNQIKRLLDRINSFVKYSNKTLTFEIEKCIFPDNDLEKYISKAKEYFKNKDNIVVNDANEYLVGINQIPMLTITNIKIKGDSLLVKTNLCGGSILNKDLYLFIWNTSKDSELFSLKGEVVLLKFKFTNHQDYNIYYKGVENIINSIHYIKYKLNCKNE